MQVNTALLKINTSLLRMPFWKGMPLCSCRKQPSRPPREGVPSLPHLLIPTVVETIVEAAATSTMLSTEKGSPPITFTLSPRTCYWEDPECEGTDVLLFPNANPEIGQHTFYLARSSVRGSQGWAEGRWVVKAQLPFYEEKWEVATTRWEHRCTSHVCYF